MARIISPCRQRVKENMVNNTLDQKAVLSWLLSIGQTSTYVILEELMRRQYDVSSPYWPHSTITFTTPMQQKRTIVGVTCQQTSLMPRAFSNNKYIMNIIAERKGLPILPYELYEGPESAENFWHKYNGKCILKQAKGAGGKGVKINFSGLNDYLAQAERMKSSEVLIMQKRSVGEQDIRLLFIGGKFIAATKRRAFYIQGDGNRTLGELIAYENENRKVSNNIHHPTMPLSNLEVSDVEQTSGVACNDILPDGTVVQASLANIASGGTAKNITDLLHPGFITMSQSLVVELDSPVVAIDFLTSDYTSDPLDSDSETTFLETNLKPGIDLHEYPHTGNGIPVASHYVDYVIENCQK